MKSLLTLTLTACLLLIATAALAHTPLFSCYDNGDKTISCEGGFSDGSSAAGMAVHIKDGSGAVIQEAKLDENSEITFDKPSGEYTVQFDAGEGHQIDVPGDTIVE